MRGIVIENGNYSLVEDLEVRDPRPNEVRVAVHRSGLCASDLIWEHFPSPTPIVLGHEAAGVIAEVGSAVSGLSVGQRVAVTTQRPCMRCRACARGLYTACPTAMDDPEAPFTQGGRPVRSYARSSSLAEEIVVDELQVHPIADHIGLEGAALVGCAVTTGFGMIRNVAKLRPGQLVGVLGVGGIGINAIQAARLGGASRIIAVDINAAREESARAFGADDFLAISPGTAPEETAERFIELAGRPVDAVIEGTGHPDMISAGIRMLDQGGTLAQVGMPSSAASASFDITDLMMRHISIVGALNGATNPFLDPQALVHAAGRGDINLADQVTHRFPLERYEEAFAKLKSGEALRVVVDLV